MKYIRKKWKNQGSSQDLGGQLGPAPSPINMIKDQTHYIQENTNNRILMIHKISKPDMKNKMSLPPSYHVNINSQHLLSQILPDTETLGG